MYFSNIANSELKHFHQTIGVDFSISLSEILHKTNNVFDNKLFFIEDCGNNIYKVFPLFYCKNVISSNADDKVDNNRCLILMKDLEHETYISFMTNEEKSNVLINESILNIKSINENLSIDEFNAFVYHLRQLGVIKGILNYKNITDIVGSYGEYIFNNVDEQLKNDVGLVINDKLKNNPITVKLVNPFFLNAKYTLKCTVISLTGANICDENKGDFIVKDTFNVDLVENIEIPLNVANYTNDSVLLFDIDVDISFDVPEIVNSDFSLDFVVSAERIVIGDELTLTATLTGDNVAGYNVSFFEDDVLIETLATDEFGVAEIDYTPVVSNTHNYSCRVIGLYGSANVVVYNRNTMLSLSVAETDVEINSDVVLNGVLLDYDENPLADMPINLYKNNVLIDVLNTDNNGEFGKTITETIVNNYAYYVEYNGIRGYLSATSNLINIRVHKYQTSISLSTDKSLVYIKPAGDTTSNFTITGTLLEKDEPMTNTIVEIYNDTLKVDEVTTDNNGTFSKTFYPNGVPQTYKITAKYKGTTSIQEATSTMINVVARKINTYLSCNVETNPIYINELAHITGRLRDEFNNGLADCIITPSGTSIEIVTGTNGVYDFYYPRLTTITSKTFNIAFNGNTTTRDISSTHNTVTSNTVTVSSIKYPVEVDILNTAEYYVVGDTIKIGVTSADANFNPNSVNVVFNNNSYTVNSKDSDGNFIFTIPAISQSQGDFNISASFSEDETHASDSDAKTIFVYNNTSLQILTVETSGSKGIKVTTKNKKGVNIPNLVIPTLILNLTGFPSVVEINIENATFNSNGQWSWADMGDYIHGTGTIKAVVDNIESNVINVSWS